MRFFCFLLGVFVLAGCATGSEELKEKTEQETMMHSHAAHGEQFTKHYDNSMFKPTDHGLYSVELVVEEGKLSVGENKMDIIVHNREDRDVKGARITVEPWMPMHGHGIPGTPEISERGGGIYSAQKVHLTMPGHWQLKISVNAGAGEDSVTFDFPDVMPREGMLEGHAGHMEHGEAGEHAMHKDMSVSRMPEEKDFSKTRTSRRGDLSVSYSPEPDTIPVGKVHAWTLNIKDAQGKPLEDAEISVEGWMPEHGHGMQTQPEATMSLEKGSYLIEGMHFSMPGFWTVTFMIQNENISDSVVFMLDLK